MLISRGLSEFVRYLFRKYGFDIVRVKEHSLNKIDLLSSIEFDNIHTHIFKISDYSNICTYRGVSIKNFDSDPYLYALSKSILHKDKSDFILEFVSRISIKIQSDRSAGEAMKLFDRKDLLNKPEWCAVLPWESSTMSDKLINYPNVFLKSRPDLLGLNNESLFYSDKVWESHATQFFELIKSIKENGFYNTSWPIVNIMIKNFKFRVGLSSSGNHRLMTASVLDMDNVYVKIGRVVDYNDACMWPNVLNGTYTEDEAKTIFDLFFNGDGCGSYV